jgi:hypothetical protein
MQRRDWGAKYKRLQIGVCLIFVLCSIGSSAGSPPQCLPSSNIFAFLHVNIIPMNREAVLTDQTLIVCDGRIAAVGPAESIPIPRSAQRIDGRGKYLILGLTDAHVHLLG